MVSSWLSFLVLIFPYLFYVFMKDERLVLKNRSSVFYFSPSRRFFLLSLHLCLPWLLLFFFFSSLHLFLLPPYTPSRKAHSRLSVSSSAIDARRNRTALHQFLGVPIEVGLSSCQRRGGPPLEKQCGRHLVRWLATPRWHGEPCPAVNNRMREKNVSTPASIQSTSTS